MIKITNFSSHIYNNLAFSFFKFIWKRVSLTPTHSLIQETNRETPNSETRFL